MARTEQSEPNARGEALEEKPAALKRLAVGGSIPSLATILSSVSRFRPKQKLGKQ